MKRRWCRNEVIINSWESTTQASALFGYSDCVLQYDKNVFIPSTLSKQSIPIRSNPKPPYYITKLTVIVSCANQVKLPYIQKIEDLKKSIMLLFFQCILPTPSLFFYPFLGCTLFCMGINFLSHILLRLMYLWVWCSMVSFMLILILMLVVTEALCSPVLLCTTFVVKTNEIFCLIT